METFKSWRRNRTAQEGNGNNQVMDNVDKQFDEMKIYPDYTLYEMRAGNGDFYLTNKKPFEGSYVFLTPKEMKIARQFQDDVADKFRQKVMKENFEQFHTDYEIQKVDGYNLYVLYPSGQEKNIAPVFDRYLKSQQRVAVQQKRKAVVQNTLVNISTLMDKVSSIAVKTHNDLAVVEEALTNVTLLFKKLGIEDVEVENDVINALQVMRELRKYYTA